MDSLAAELQMREIISAKAAVNIRRHIEAKYPQLSSVQRARIFADTVNRIVESNLSGFGEEQVKMLKQLLFRDAARKSAFSIECSDIFVSALKMNTVEPDFVNPLKQWLKEAAHINIDSEALTEIVSNAHKKLKAGPEENILDVLDFAAGSFSLDNHEISHNEEREHYETDAVNGTSDMDGTSPAQSDTGEGMGCCEANAADTREETVFQCYAEDTNIPASSVKSSLLRLCTPRKICVSAASCLIIFSIIAYSGVIFARSGESNGEAYAETMKSANIIPQNFNSGQSEMADTGSAGNDSTTIRRMRATAYDLSIESCGKSREHPAYGITSSGKKATVGRTVAVDPEVIPLGTRLQITFPPEYSHMDGVYIAEDTGSLIKGDKIDIFFGEDRPGSREVYKKAMRFGVRYVDVRILDQ